MTYMYTCIHVNRERQIKSRAAEYRRTSISIGGYSLVQIGIFFDMKPG